MYNIMYSLYVCIIMYVYMYVYVCICMYMYIGMYCICLAKHTAREGGGGVLCKVAAD